MYEIIPTKRRLLFMKGRIPVTLDSWISVPCLVSGFHPLSAENPLPGGAHLICLRCLLQTTMNPSATGGFISLCFDFRECLSTSFLPSAWILDD